MKPPLPKRFLARLMPVGVAAALALVYAAYQSPELTIDLANRIWACF
jgi:hypothetical protein